MSSTYNYNARKYNKINTCILYELKMKRDTLRSELCSIYDVIESGRNLHCKILADDYKELKWVIPNYQRNYCWTAENFNSFIDTMEKLGQSASADINFFGQLIVHVEAEDSLQIVDGQQRLTTYLILATVLLEYYESLPDEEFNSDDREKLRQYLYLENNLPRFEHRSKNKRVIEEYIYLMEPCSSSEQQIKSLYNEYKNDLNDSLKRIEYREKLHKQYRKKNCELKATDYKSIILGHKMLYEFCNDMSQKNKKFYNFENNLISNSAIIISLLMSKSFETAYEAFMALNGEGRPLTTYDLIRSEFIGNLLKVESTLEFNVENDWNTFIDIEGLNYKKIVDIFDIMLKIEYTQFYFKFNNEHAIAKRTFLRDMLHSLIKNENPLEIYEKFKCYITNYQKMKEGNFNKVIGSDSYKKFDNDVRLCIEMGYVPFLPLLFEYINNPDIQNEDYLLVILNTIKYVPFVYVTVCGLRASHLTDAMTKYLDPDNERSHFEKINSIKKKFINEKIKETFKINLPETTISAEAVSKGILLLLEGIEGATSHLMHLEHIYPQKAKSKEWPGITKESLNKIGNHVIISKKMNEALKNFSLEKKMKIISEKFSEDVVKYKYFNDLYTQYENENFQYDDKKIIDRGEKYTNDLIKKFEEIGLF